jgi:hypothetical protein
MATRTHEMFIAVKRGDEAPSDPDAAAINDQLTRRPSQGGAGGAGAERQRT